MCRKLVLKSAFWMPLACIAASAQAQSQFQIFQQQGNSFKNSLQVKYKPAASGDRWFSSAVPPAASLCNYSIYVVFYPDEPRMKVVDETANYLYDSSGAPPCDASRIQLPGADASEKQVTIPLRAPLHFGTRYMVTIRDPNDPNPDTNSLTALFNGAASLTLEPMDSSKVTLKVTSTVWLNATPGMRVKLVNHTPSGDLPLDAVIETVSPSGVFVKLLDKLPNGSGGAFQLATKDLFDSYGKEIAAQGKISISAPAVPPTPAAGTRTSAANATPAANSAFITAQLSAVAAVHSNPTFSATGAIGPWNKAIKMIELPGTNGIFFDPVVNFDVGTTNAKSSNSVIVPSEFTRDFTLMEKDRNADEENRKCLAGQAICQGTNSDIGSAHQPSSLNTSFGARAEFDTLYGGVNLLGEGRVDLYMSWLYKTSASRRAAIAAGNPAIRDLLQMPDKGYSIAPYLQYDGGGHMNAQTIANSGQNAAALIPTYDISRLYLGVVATGTWHLSSLTFDGSWTDLFTQETVPTTINKVVYSKNLSNFQPHAKGSYSLTLDQMKHYVLTICWENGRSAPTFAYVNKATAGIQIVY